jgi:prepilin-type N-terminal cleavage/methylation domain-containing protein
VLRMQASGFSLLEMLAVISIFLILAVVSVIAWNSAGPGMVLNSAAQGLSNTLDLCILKAETERTEYFVVLSYTSKLYRCTDGPILHFPANSYVLVRDDGWLQTGSGKRKYNSNTMHGAPTPSNVEFAEEWESGKDYAVNTRHNNLIEKRELYKGPLKLGRGINFQSPPDGSPPVRRIVSSFQEPKMYWQSSPTADTINEPISLNDRQYGPAKIYLSNQFYKFGDTSKDNKAHLKIIKATATKIETFSPA